MKVLCAGDITTGWSFHGPCPDHMATRETAEAMGLPAGTHTAWEEIQPDDDNMAGTHILVYGEPQSGFSFKGPFRDAECAMDWAETELRRITWWTAEIKPIPAERQATQPVVEVPTADMPGRVIARFVPQIWIRDTSMRLEAGHRYYDITALIDTMDKDNALALRDDQYETDNLVPQHMRDHHEGPFLIEVEQQIRRYFDKGDQLP